MSSSVIISSFLQSVAEEVDAPEKSIIYNWEEAKDHRYSEEVIIIDTKVSEGPMRHREMPVAGEGAYETMSIFSESLDNLLESGRTVIALLDYPTDVYATENRTVGFSNYQWLPREIGRAQTHELMEDEDEDFFINQTPDTLDSWPVKAVQRERPFNTYFANVEGTWTWLDTDNSSIVEYETISTTSHPEIDALSGIAINGWENEQGEFSPPGTLVLLPRPDRFWFDVDDWFRSLLEIGYYYTSQSDDFDQFNRRLGRVTYQPLKDVYEICHRFPTCASALSNRRGDREPINIDDEYDVQYLLEPLLRTRFDDVRPEEYGPSHGGPAPRIDFLLKDTTIVVEVKITRAGRGNDDIRTELAEDKEQYRTHPDCKYQICYIYDPGHEIENPAGFESDLSEETDNLITEVIVSSTPRFTTP